MMHGVGDPRHDSYGCDVDGGPHYRPAHGLREVPLAPSMVTCHMANGPHEEPVHDEERDWHHELDEDPRRTKRDDQHEAEHDHRDASLAFEPAEVSDPVDPPARLRAGTRAVRRARRRVALPWSVVEVVVTKTEAGMEQRRERTGDDGPPQREDELRLDPTGQVDRRR